MEKITKGNKGNLRFPFEPSLQREPMYSDKRSLSYALLIPPFIHSFIKGRGHRGRSKAEP